MKDYDYLTNISRNKKSIIEEAARRSGFNVEYRDHPVPKDFSDPEDEFYEPSLLRDCGSVYTNEPRDKDHSPFWEMVDTVEKERNT